MDGERLASYWGRILIDSSPHVDGLDESKAIRMEEFCLRVQQIERKIDETARTEDRTWPSFTLQNQGSIIVSVYPMKT